MGSLSLLAGFLGQPETDGAWLLVKAWTAIKK